MNAIVKRSLAEIIAERKAQTEPQREIARLGSVGEAAEGQDASTLSLQEPTYPPIPFKRPTLAEILAAKRVKDIINSIDKEPIINKEKKENIYSKYFNLTKTYNKSILYR